MLLCSVCLFLALWVPISFHLLSQAIDFRFLALLVLFAFAAWNYRFNTIWSISSEQIKDSWQRRISKRPFRG